MNPPWFCCFGKSKALKVLKVEEEAKERSLHGVLFGGDFRVF